MTPIKKLIVKLLTVREPITLAALRMQLNAKGISIAARDLRIEIANLEREGYLHISNGRGHKLANTTKEYQEYLDYLTKYLKSFSKKKKQAEKNWKRLTSKLFVK